MSKPSSYTDEIATEICERIASGETLNGVCRGDGMPSAPLVRRWVLQNVNGFAERYAHARSLQLDVWADEVVTIADDAATYKDMPSVQAAKLRSDNRKWLLSKLRPQQYGDRTELVGAGGRDLIPARGNDAQNAAAALMLLVKQRAIKTINGTVDGGSNGGMDLPALPSPSVSAADEGELDG